MPKLEGWNWGQHILRFCLQLLKILKFWNILVVDFWEKLARALPYTDVFEIKKRKIGRSFVLFLVIFWIENSKKKIFSVDFFLENLARGSPYFWFLNVWLEMFQKFENFVKKKNVSFWNFALFLYRVCAESVQREYWFFQNFAFFCAELCRVLGNSWCCWIFWKFSKSFKSRKIWPGVCPILEILSFCLRLLKI